MSILKVKRKLNKIINSRFIVILIVVAAIFITLAYRIFSLIIVNGDIYEGLLSSKREVYVEGITAPRGRIYDRNYNVIVDNKPIPTIMYEKQKGVSSNKEVELAYTVSKLIDMNTSRVTTRDKKDFWMILNKDEAKNKITQDEYQAFREKKLTDNDIYQMKLERITEADLATLSEDDIEALAVFSEMRRGNKIIKNVDVTYEELALVSEKLDELPGFKTEIDWERVYPYGDCFRTILGRVSSTSQGIPAEKASEYIAKGYKLNDRVGISYLEYQYEDLLRGTKSLYRVKNGSYEVVKEGSRGHDLVLSIDMNFQCGLEEILKQEITSAKSEPQTKYFDKAYAVVSDPRTGEIIGMSAKQYIVDEEGKPQIIDYSPGLITSSVTAGSVVKGASVAAGYKYNAIDIGSVLFDEPIKIAGTPFKKSWKDMGAINDVTALAWSSNVYMFKTAMKIANANYQFDKPLPIDTTAFKKYRDTYAEFGLGIKTGIDLPGEFVGYKSNSLLPGHLFDFTIGQYDTYTPMQLAQYINTIANGGYRIKPTLLKEVYTSTKTGELDELTYKVNPTVYNKLSIEQKYVDRIVQGFRAVLTQSGATGIGFMPEQYLPAGKTGTAESFTDANGNGIYNTPTVSKTFAGFAPYNDPKMSIVVVAPDVTYPENGKVAYTSMVTKRISNRITNLFFENVK